MAGAGKVMELLFSEDFDWKDEMDFYKKFGESFDWKSPPPFMNMVFSEDFSGWP